MSRETYAEPAVFFSDQNSKIMPVIEITSLDFPEVSVYSRLTERQLRSADADGNGIFIAESPKVIRVALRAGYEPLSSSYDERRIC